MNGRREFLVALGFGALTPSTNVGGGPRLRRSRWELLFAGPETTAPGCIPDPASWVADDFTAAWIGHATVLLNFFGTWILTDPVMSSRVGFHIAGIVFGPRRLVAPALSLERMPKPDLVLLSHAHFDHLDIPTLEHIDPGASVVTAANTADLLDDLPLRHVVELDWGEKISVKGVEIEALPVKHFGWRLPWEQDRSRGNADGRSYNAYLVSKKGRSFVFAGDTAYHDRFREVRQRVGNLELAIMPIGAYDPWIHVHCTPEQAVEMAGHLGARVVMPVHWGTFIQSDEETGEPIRRFLEAARLAGILPAVKRIGETWSASARTAW
ncbi:MAG: MBL fold metallo-hydrolase [Bacteroidota bacterium]|nr:MBL fold metallo-hydrolase [Bacteroidota bacterium]